MGHGAEVIPLIGEPLTKGWPSEDLDLAGVQVDRSKYPALQQNAAQVKGKHRVLPKPLVVKVAVNGHPARALLDSGSLGDFIIWDIVVMPSTHPRLM